MRLIYTPEERPARRKAKAKEWRTANRDHLRAYMTAWRARNKDKLLAYQRANSGKYESRRRAATRRYGLKFKYGVTLDQFRNMLVGQAGRCLICQKVPTTTLVVDHDHATGHIRGLLCNSCNRLLGIAGDSPKRLAAAIRYLDVAS